MAPNLQKRGDVYYARIAVPKSLRDLREAANFEPNPPEVWKSLRTPDRSVAERLLLTVKAEILRAFDLEEERLRREGVRSLSLPTIEDLGSMKEEFFLDVLGRDELSRLARKSVAEIDQMRKELVASLQKCPPENELALLAAPGVVELMSAKDAAEDAAANRNILRNELQKHLAHQNFVLVSDTLEAMARERGLAIEPNSLNYKLLGKQLLGAWQAALKVSDRRDEGIADEAAGPLAMVSPAPSLPTGARLGSVVELKPRQGRPAKGESLKDYFGRYLKEQKADMPLPSQRELWATLRLFMECNGDHPVASYTKAHMAAFKTALHAYPKNAAKLYPGLKFKQAVEQNRKDQHPTISSATQRNKLSTISAFGKWLESNADGVDAINFGTTLPKRTGRQRMEPFTLDEVRQILNSTAFVGCESDKNYQKPGSFKLRDWHFWLVLVAAFTGARVNEIVQMDLDDLRQVDGVWAFDITDDGEDKSLKTGSSKRLMPVHPRLIELGLLQYRAELLARGAKFLFEDAPVGQNGRRSEAASRWFRRFLEKIGVKGEGDLGGAHRWRHTFVDALRRAGVEEYDIAILTGHRIDVARMTGHYGRELNTSLARRLEIVSKVDYPGVDFSALRTC